MRPRRADSWAITEIVRAGTRSFSARNENLAHKSFVANQRPLTNEPFCAIIFLRSNNVLSTEHLLERETKMAADYHVPSVARAISILYFLREQPHPKSTLSELCRALDINKSTAYAILKTLQAKGIVVCDEQSKRYSLGLPLIELASAVSSQLSHVTLIKPVLRRLVHELGLTCSLSQRNTSDTLIIVEMMESETEVRITFPIGRQLPLPSGAAGKCFLAYLPKGETEVILRRVKLPAYTPQSITDVEVYKKELLQVRRDGFATSMGERSCIARCRIWHDLDFTK
jgi:DNA-binding IclR family transcriptional regulator